MKRTGLPFEAALRSFQRLVAWFMPSDHNPESPQAFKIETIVSVSILVGNSGFPFMLLFFYMQHPKKQLSYCGHGYSL